MKKYQFVKLKSAVTKIPVMNAVCPFTNDEITQAKRCMLNKWEKPPDFEKRRQKLEYEVRRSPTAAASGENRESFLSGERNEKEEKASEESKKDIDDAKDLKDDKDDDGDKPEAAVEPKTRAPGGMWVEASDIAHCFQYLLVFHNPRAFASKLCWKDLWTNPQESFIPNEDRLFLTFKPEEKAEADSARQNVISEEFKDLPVDIEHERTKVLVAFAPNGCQPSSQPAPLYSFALVNVRTVHEQLESDVGAQADELLVRETDLGQRGRTAAGRAA